MTVKRTEAVAWGVATWGLGVGLVAVFGTTAHPVAVTALTVLGTIPGMAIATRIFLRDVAPEARAAAATSFGAYFLAAHLSLDPVFWAVQFRLGWPETTEPICQGMAIGLGLLYLEMQVVPWWVGRRS